MKRFTLMIKNLILLFNFIILFGCSSDNSIVSNPITGEKKTPGIFSKDSNKGISLSDLLDPQSSETGVNVNGYLWRASLDILSIAHIVWRCIDICIWVYIYRGGYTPTHIGQ